MELDHIQRRALALFEDSEISVAIGKSGQNVRLASKVTGYEIDAKSRSEVEGGVEEEIFLVDVDTLPTRVVNIKGLGEKLLDEFMDALQEAVEIEEVVEEVLVDDNGEENDTETVEESKEA